MDKNFSDELTDNAFAYLSEYSRQTEKHANRAVVAALFFPMFGGLIIICGVAAACFGFSESYLTFPLGVCVIVPFLSAVIFSFVR